MDPKEYEQFEQACAMENKIDAACDDVMDAFRENVIKRQKLDAPSPADGQEGDVCPYCGSFKVSDPTNPWTHFACGVIKNPHTGKFCNETLPCTENQRDNLKAEQEKT